jgi:hypothetical protein
MRGGFGFTSLAMSDTAELSCIRGPSSPPSPRAITVLRFTFSGVEKELGKLVFSALPDQVFIAQWFPVGSQAGA